MGLIDDDAVVACNGVIACDHAINAATANPIPIVPVENNSLRITASFVFVECCYDEELAFQDFAVAFRKWCRAKFVCFVGDPECRRRFREKLRTKQPHRSVKMYSRLSIATAMAWTCWQHQPFPRR